jgi:N-methylhydantoinase B
MQPTVRTKSGDTVRTISPCGGGYGDPLERDPELVLNDVLDGIVCKRNAREQYGVVFSDGTVDAGATEGLRREMRARNTG